MSQVFPTFHDAQSLRATFEPAGPRQRRAPAQSGGRAPAIPQRAVLRRRSRWTARPVRRGDRAGGRGRAAFSERTFVSIIEQAAKRLEELKTARRGGARRADRAGIAKSGAPDGAAAPRPRRRATAARIRDAARPRGGSTGLAQREHRPGEARGGRLPDAGHAPFAARERVPRHQAPAPRERPVATGNARSERQPHPGDQLDRG